MRRTVGFVVAVVLASWVALGAAADGAGSVSGQVTVDGETIAPTSGAALWTVSTGWNAGERQVEVVLAPEEVSVEEADRALTPKNAVRNSVEGDLVAITLGADGSLQMFYAFLADGSRNFGFGDGGKAEVTIADGRVLGRVYTEGEASIGDTPIAFDLSFDLPIMPERAPGRALEAGGGEPGAAYLAFVEAQRSGDVPALLRHLDKGRAEGLAETPEDFRGYVLDSYKEMANQDMVVTGGELFDGWAIVTVAGKDWSGSKVEGRVKMELDGESWRFVEEALSMVWE